MRNPRPAGGELDAQRGVVRLKIPVGVSNNSDVHLAMRLCVEAAEAAEAADRVLATPEPCCLLMGFGDSSAFGSSSKNTESKSPSHNAVYT